MSTHSLHLHPLHSLCHCSSSSLSSPPFIPGPNHRSLMDSEVNSGVFLVAGHFAGRDRSPLNWAFPEPDDWGLCFLGFVCSFCPLAAPCTQGWEEQSQVTCLTHQGGCRRLGKSNGLLKSTPGAGGGSHSPASDRCSARSPGCPVPPLPSHTQYDRWVSVGDRSSLSQFTVWIQGELKLQNWQRWEWGVAKGKR